MKKMVLGMVIGMIISAIVSGLCISSITSDYESKIAKVKSSDEQSVRILNSELEETTKDYTEVSGSYEELMNEVYKMMNGKAYKVKIEHEDETHIYEKTKAGLFSDVSHTVIK